jgi:hypothetical protein
MPQYLGIFARHDYTDNEGNTQTRWYKAGYMKLTENGGKFLRFFHQPQTDFFCFEGDQNPLPEIQLKD